jgi:hypothetical protein
MATQKLKELFGKYYNVEGGFLKLVKYINAGFKHVKLINYIDCTEEQLNDVLSKYFHFDEDDFCLPHYIRFGNKRVNIGIESSNVLVIDMFNNETYIDYLEDDEEQYMEREVCACCERKSNPCNEIFTPFRGERYCGDCGVMKDTNDEEEEEDETELCYECGDELIDKVGLFEGKKRCMDCHKVVMDEYHDNLFKKFEEEDKEQFPEDHFTFIGKRCYGGYYICRHCSWMDVLPTSHVEHSYGFCKYIRSKYDISYEDGEVIATEKNKQKKPQKQFSGNGCMFSKYYNN